MIDTKTLGDLIDRAAERWPDRTAIINERKVITYRDLKERADRLAAALLKIGMKKGDKVAVLFTNLPQWSYAEFAVVKIGAVVVPINTRYTPAELEYILRHSDASTILMMDRFQKTDYMETVNGLCPELSRSERGRLQCERLPCLKNVVVSGRQRYPGAFQFEELLNGGAGGDPAEVRRAQARVAPDDIAHMPYTSGTTGNPKGVMTTHDQYIRFNLGFINGIGGFTPGDRLLVAPPFSHNFGNSQGILTPAFCGAASVLIESFDEVECLDLIEKHGITFFAGSPTMYIRMLRHPDFERFDLSSLRAGLIAAAPAPVPVIEEIRSRMGIEILVNGYGMTENSVGTSMTRPGDPPEILAKTVGKPLWPEYEVKVVDIKTGLDLAPGSEGEICTRGPLVMKGYYKAAEETRKLVDENGWFHTGDVGIVDASGYIHITGRLKDIFMPGGLNVSPEEVEEVIMTHPKVRQVSVLGVPDDVLGEAGAAFVQLKERESATSEEIIGYCKNRIAGFKIPKHVFFTSDFPMTTSGKVQRFILKERAMEHLGIGKAR